LTIALQGDRFSMRNTDTGWSIAGTLDVEGSQVTMRDTIGDVFDYRWSVYRDKLTLAKTPGVAAPTGFTVKAWSRAAHTSAPSLSPSP
jgi:hypothetical protein